MLVKLQLSFVYERVSTLALSLYFLLKDLYALLISNEARAFMSASFIPCVGLWDASLP